jgi:AraC-like DNA-binding protein
MTNAGRRDLGPRLLPRGSRPGPTGLEEGDSPVSSARTRAQSWRVFGRLVCNPARTKRRSGGSEGASSLVALSAMTSSPTTGLCSTGKCRICCRVTHRPTTDGFYREVVRKARARLRLNPCQAPSELAQALACSERTLNRAFASTGTTVRDESRRLRLDRAALTLLGGKPPSEAARRAGYASSRQLAEPFRKRYGATPSRVRDVGRAIKTVRWQASQRGPYRGSWQQRGRRETWRAARRVLRAAHAELIQGTIPASRVDDALKLRLQRPRKSKTPLALYEVFGPAASWIPEDVLRQTVAFRGRAWRASR